MERRLQDPLGAFRAMFEALGFQVATEEDWAFSARKETAEGGRSFDVWVPPLGADEASIDGEEARRGILQDLDALAKSGADATRLVLLPSLLTLGPSFQTELRERGALVRAYGQFLDDDYKAPTDAADPLILTRSAEEWRAARELRAERDRLRARSLRLLSDEMLQGLSGVDPSQLRGRRRVEQRYTVRRAAPEAQARLDGAGDLLADLAAYLAEDPAERPEVILVVGHAGVGKSEMFEALYAYLARLFADLKAKQRVAARPVRFTPEELAQTPSYSSSELFAAVAEAPEAAFGAVDLLDWRMRQGLMLLMFDGLDEFFAAQDDFFDELKSRYLAAGSRAKILICLRDSLLATSPQVKALVSALDADPDCALSIVELEPWTATERLREFAWVRLEGRPPKEGEADTPAVAEFLGVVLGSPELREVASLPFFLEAILSYRRAEDESSLSVLEILRRLVDDIVEREWKKLEATSQGGRAPQSAFATHSDAAIGMRADFFLWLKHSTPVMFLERVFGAAPVTWDQQEAVDEIFDSFAAAEGREGFERLIEDVAYAIRRGGTGHGVTRERLIEIYGRDRPSAMSPELRARGELILRQFALFGFDGADSVDFNHVIVADYLAGLAAARRLREGGGDVSTALGTAPPDETAIFWRCVEDGVADKPEILDAVRSARAAKQAA